MSFQERAKALFITMLKPDIATKDGLCTRCSQPVKKGEKIMVAEHLCDCGAQYHPDCVING